MAPRAKAKKAVPGATSAERQGKGGASPTVNAAKLHEECLALRVELKAAREEIARLQKRQELVVNRIDWVIDSLHNLMDDEG